MIDLKNAYELRSVLSDKVIDKIEEVQTGNIWYEAWKKLPASGLFPLTLNKCKGADLVDYKIYGESVQDGEPTPETPVEVESVGEKTKNLFNKSNVEQGSLMDATGEKINSNYRVRTKEFITLEAGTYIVSSSDVKIRIIHIYNYDSEKWEDKKGEGNYNDITFTLTKKSKIKIVFQYAYNNTTVITPDNVKNSNVQLEVGSTVTEYEPYGYKIPVKASIKSLFYTDPMKLTLNMSGKRVSFIYPKNEVILTPNTYKLTIFTSNEINLKHGLKYSILITEGGTNKEIYLEGSGQSTNGVFTVTQETILKSVYVFLSTNENSTGQITINNVQLEIGATTTEPVTTNIYLNEPLRKIGDYADYIDFESKKIVRSIEENTWKGSENWSYVTGLIVTGISKPLDNNSIVMGMCSHYKSYPYGSLFSIRNNPDTQGFAVAGMIRISDNINFGSDITKFKSWLVEQYNNGTPVKSYYVLATPDPQPIELPNIPTHKGTTILSVDTTIQPSNAEVKYMGKP